MHDQPNDNGSNMKLNYFYGSTRMNYMRHHGTLNFTPAHMNYILVATWDDLKLSSATIDQNSFKKAHILPLYPPEIDTNHHACLTGTKQLNR